MDFMKTNWLKQFLLAGSVTALSVSAAQAQTIFDFDEALGPDNWTLSPAYPADPAYPGESIHGVNGGIVEFIGGGCGCGGGDYALGLAFDGPDRFYYDAGIADGGVLGSFLSGPVRLSASVNIPFTATLRFDFLAMTMDTRGWGDGVNVYESAGYIINRSGIDIATVSLTPSDGYAPIYTPGIVYAPGARYAIPLQAGDRLTFYLDSFDSLGGLDDGAGGFVDGGAAQFVIMNAIYSSVPEPGEWMALAGVGLMGFAGVRRWRQNQAAVNA